MKPLTAPLAQIALANSRPSPPSSRPMRIVPPTALEPDRSHIDKPAPEAAEVAGKKKGKKKIRLDESRKGKMLERFHALTAAEPDSYKTDIVLRVAEEFGVSKSVLYRELQAAGNGRPVKAEPEQVRLDGLDLILDIIELCERAKKGLSKSQRGRLRAALNERLS